MKLIRTVDAAGQVLCHDITQIIPGEYKDARFRKGHVIQPEDIPVLLSIGKENLYVWEKHPGILHEDEAAALLYKAAAGKNIHGTAPKEGKIELIADCDGLLKINRRALMAVNSTPQMMIATIHGDLPVKKGQKLAGTRIIPLVIEQEKMDAMQAAAGAEPILNVLPMQAKKFAVITTGSEVFKGRIEDKFTPILVGKLAEYGCTRALENGLNKVELGDGKVGVITASISYQYAKEVFPEGTSFLKLGLTYPLPMDLIRDFAKKVEKLYIIEELDPFMEDEIKAAGIDCVGKELTGKLYELNTELVRERVLGIKPAYKTVDEVKVAKRPPALCPGCPHRGFFYTLSKNKNYVVTGDIGCYTLGFAPPLNCMDVCICMGGGFSAGMGMAKSFQREGVTDKVVFGVMGDSTFFHSGMTGAAEIIYNNGRMIPCVLDNRITGMTGHQDNPGSGFTLMGEPAPMISVEKVLEAYGFVPVFTVDPQDLTAMKKTVDDAVAALNEGKHPAIVTRRPCLLIKRVKHDTGMCVVNADKCKSCKSCLKVGCPAISMENGKAFIDRTQCVGCTVCAQACPFGAIEKEEK